MTYLLLISTFLKYATACKKSKSSKNLMHSINNYTIKSVKVIKAIKETLILNFTTTIKKIIHMNNALFTKY